MLVQWGNVRELSSLPWAMLELNECRVNEATLHICRWARTHLPNIPFQLLFPVKSRDISGMQMICPYLLVRTRELSTLSDLSKMYGVWPMVDGAGKIIPVEDEFAQEILQQTERESSGWSVGTKVGSFVRILYGPEHMLCGEVQSISRNIAEVCVRLRMRKVYVKIPVRALLNLGNVPKRKREYFYR